MKRTIWKWFWTWDFDKEEKWLNEMAARGLVLVTVNFCKYDFEECNPGEFNVRLELLENLPTHAESQQYIKFIEETGAEHIGSVTRWVYFRNKTDNGEFNLFSDNESRIKHLNLMLTLLGAAIFPNVFIGLSNISIFLCTRTIINLICGILCLTLSLFITFGSLRVYRKKRKMKQEQQLFE